MLQLFFKLSGTAAVVCCGWMVGSGLAGNLQRQTAFYEDLIALCELLENNVQHLRRPLPDFFSQEMERHCFRVLRIPQRQETDFALWRSRAWQEIARQSGLKQPALEDIRIFWNSLGSGGSEEETERIRYYRSTFEQALIDARDQENRSSRVYRSLGICGGMVMALLIL